MLSVLLPCTVPFPRMTGECDAGTLGCRSSMHRAQLHVQVQCRPGDLVTRQAAVSRGGARGECDEPRELSFWTERLDDHLCLLECTSEKARKGRARGQTPKGLGQDHRPTSFALETSVGLRRSGIWDRGPQSGGSSAASSACRFLSLSRFPTRLEGGRQTACPCGRRQAGS